MNPTECRTGARHEREVEYLELLLRAGELLDRSLDYNQTLDNVCKAAVESIADICLICLGPAEGLRLAAAAHRFPERVRQLRGADEFVRRTAERAAHPIRVAMAKQEPLLIAHVDSEFVAAHATSDGHREFLSRVGYRSLIILPLKSKTEGVLGVLVLARTESQTPFDRADLRFSSDMARRCSTAIAKSMLYAKSVSIASRFQEAALPRGLPHLPGVTLDAVYEPSSEELLVGGDWYDAFSLPDGRIAITVGDVLGHGIDAAVWMGRLRNALRAALLSDPEPSSALSVADRLIRLDSDDEFSTAVVAIVDPQRRTICCASAGHPGPLIWDPSGAVVDPFSERALPLGLHDLDRSAPERRSETIALQPGSFAVFFTDGLLESKRDVAASWELLQEALLRREVRQSERPAHAIREAVIATEGHQDDLAILTLRVDAP